MGTLTLTFTGICVHMTTLNPFRVVVPAVDSSGGGYTLAPVLVVGERTIPLTGQTFFLGKVRPDAAATVDIECTPRLSLAVPTMKLSEPVAFLRQPPAAAYFDIFEGNVTLSQAANDLDPSAYAQLRIDFDGDAMDIPMQNWSDGSVEMIRVDDQTGPIKMSNAPMPAAPFHDPSEYALNLLIAENFELLNNPDGYALLEVALDAMVVCLNARIPEEATPTPTPLAAFENNYFETFPSCSNSQWP